MCAILCRVYLACNSTLPATQPYAAIKVTFDHPRGHCTRGDLSELVRNVT